LSEPVTWDLVGSEHLFSELLVATVLYGVDFESVRVGVDHMVLGVQIRNWHHASKSSESKVDDDLGVWDLWSSNEHKELGDIMGHLRS